MARIAKAPIPITIVAGPRGAGKTTLINRLLADPRFANTAVVLNDFGEIELSGGIVERTEAGFVALGAGCVCCAVRGALTDGLENLLRDLDNGRAEAIGRVVIEADSAADPGAIFAAVERHPYLVIRFVADGVVTVIDGTAAEATLRENADAVRQVAMADIVVLSRFAGASSALPVLAAINPHARIGDADTVEPAALAGYGAGEVIADERLESWADVPKADGPVVPRDGEAARIRAYAVTRDRFMSFSRLDRFIEYLSVLQGSNLMRVRGLVATGADETIVIDGIGGFFRPPTMVDRAMDPPIRFMVVARDIDRAMFEGYLDAFLGEARVDAPDATALTDNPLSLGGFAARSGK
jgi:G3E family GTPase